MEVGTVVNFQAPDGVLIEELQSAFASLSGAEAECIDVGHTIWVNISGDEPLRGLTLVSVVWTRGICDFDWVCGPENDSLESEEDILHNVRKVVGDINVMKLKYPNQFSFIPPFYVVGEVSPFP